MSRTAEHAIEADQSIKLNIRLDARQFGRMLFSMLKIGVIGFGGGSALIPVIEDEVV
jgi:chromate transporter